MNRESVPTLASDQHKHLHAFTLIELSIVLVIVGLIIGGVVVGQDLIRAAELRSVITATQKFQTAVNTFRDKYNGLPGDITDAESIWGSDVSCPLTPLNTVPKAATCNGDGNGTVDHPTATDNREWLRVMQQLANAGLITGQYTGVPYVDPNPWDSMVNVNQPAGPISQTAIFSYFVGVVDNSDICTFSGDLGHVIGMGRKQEPNSGYWLGFLTPLDMQSLDTKLDDGRPAYGRLRGVKQSCGPQPNCTTSDVSATAQYDTSNLSPACNYVYSNAY
jgi:prepilin-type N-terminal cleavage/methylation domain-containing protein